MIPAREIGTHGLPWPPAAGWQCQLLDRGWLRFVATPLRDDHQPLWLLQALLGAPSLRALPRQAALLERDGVQRVCALSETVSDRFSQSLQSASSNEFALHSDEAFLPRPCRWVLLQCWQPDPQGGGVTWLCDLQAVLAEAGPELQPALNHRFHYPAGVTAGLAGNTPLRFSRKAIEIAAADARTSLDARHAAFLQQLETEFEARGFQLHLQRGDLLLVDNHRVLHGRSAFAPGSPRLLKRLRLH